MAHSSSTPGTHRARAARLRAGTPRWDGSTAIDFTSPTGAPSRRRRLFTRLVPFVVLVAAVPFVVAWIGGTHYMSPQKVALKAHDQVLRDVINRTGDYSVTIGPLVCTEILPGKGNCLADYRSQSHTADHLMIAAAYDLTLGNGSLNLVVKLP